MSPDSSPIGVRAPRFDPAGVGLTNSDLPALVDESGTLRADFDARVWYAQPGAPFELEIGSGKGTFLVQQAALQPGTNFLGVEWAREFWLYAADRVRRRGLRNVRLLHSDATEFLRYRVRPGSVRALHMYFPDPWPKARHHKRRSLTDQFLQDAHRALEPGGELRIVTDHDEYWAWMEERFARATSGPGAMFERLAFARPESAEEGEVVGTNFERKYRREGRPFHATILRRAERC